MNILEMEDMVKGLPDQVLRQYAQFPDPQIPQFLALSEVQRREDMRQRFQAQQQGMEPTVKDQILQGGIASAMPQGAPPMDQGMAPPMAPQAPMGPEMGPPQGPVMAYRGGMMPYTMSDGGMVPGGIVRMQRGGAAPFSYESLTPAQLRKMAEVLTSLGLYSTGGLDSISFNRLPIEKRQQLFKALEREGVPSQPDTSISASQNLSEQNVPSVKQGRNLRESIYLNPATSESVAASPPPNLGAYGRIKSFDDARLFVESGSPEQIRTAYAEALNAGDEQTANAISRIAAARGKVKQSEFLEMGKQIRPLYFQEQRDIRDQQRAAEEAKALAERQQRANYLLTGQENAVVADTTPAATTTVAPDATATPPAPTDQGLGSLDRAPNMAMDSEVMNMLSKALAPQASPLEAEYEALVRSAMAEGLPPPVDLAPYAQAAETRAQTARDEAKRMAWAAALGRFGAAVAEGDIAKGIREATTDVQQGLKEGAREARTEEARAEALRLQSAESQRQATIQARQFELQSIGSLAQIAREKGASDRQAQLTATNIYADYRAQLQKNVADLKQQGALNARSFADAMENAEKMALDYIEALIQPTEEQKQEVLDRFRRQALATYGYLLSEDQLKKVSASFAKKKPESQEGKPNSRKYEVSEVPGT